MSGGGYRQGIEVEGLKPLLRTLSKLPREVNAEVRKASKTIATREADRIRAAANDTLSRAVAVSVRARSDRVPAIVSGGSRKVAVSGHPSAGQAFFGAEFGGGARPTTAQFRPHRGRHGYWLWPTLRADEERMLTEWLAALDTIVKGWSQDG